jgi:GntR family transcriptional regulator
MSSVYKYEEIVASINDKLALGHLKPGDKLPSVAELRQEFGASYGSIRTAIIILKTLGVVQGRHGVGVFIK